MQRQTSIATREIHGSIASLEDRMRRLEGLVGGIADRLGVERGLAPTLLRTRAPTDALNLTLTLNRTRTRTLYTNPYPNRYPQGQLTLPLAPAHPGRHLGWVPARGCTIRPMPVAVTCMSTWRAKGCFPRMRTGNTQAPCTRTMTSRRRRHLPARVLCGNPRGRGSHGG